MPSQDDPLDGIFIAVITNFIIEEMQHEIIKIFVKLVTEHYGAGSNFGVL
jgi:hypothetical protein